MPGKDITTGTISLKKGTYTGERRHCTPHGNQVIGIQDDDRLDRDIFAVEPLPNIDLSLDAVPFRNGLYSGNMDEEGLPHGRGRLMCDDFSYEGEWKHGSMDGIGIHSTTKSVYCGNWADDKRHGYGVETHDYLECSSRYEGSWKNDVRHGHGILKISNGTAYEGGWKDGKRHGHGTEISTLYGIKSKYVGEWKDSQKSGLGKEITILKGLKSEYKGGWKNNQKYGFGREHIDGEDFKIRSCKVNLKKVGDQ